VGVSALGDWVAIVALGLHVKDLTDSGLAVAALWVCLFGPSVLVAGWAGLLVDRIEATRLLAAASAVGALAAVAVAFSDALAPVLVLTTVLGVVFATSSPAEFSLVPLLSDEDRIQEANGHIETARYLGFGIGPLLGGLLFAAGGLELAMLVDAATFAAVAVAALALRVRRNPAARAEHEAPPRARDGIAFLFRDRLLSLAMIVAFASLLFMSAVWVGELFFVEDVLGRGEVSYGAWLSIWTLGMAFGAMLLSRRIAAAAVAAAGLIAATVQGAALALPALWLSFAFMLACGLIGGTAHGVKNVMFRSLIHVRVPANLHGRAFAAYNGIRNTAELGAFAAGGVLVALIGARGTLAYAGGLSALAGLIGVLALLRME
jgi:Na+/melibiose symporter-like transporter